MGVRSRVRRASTSSGVFHLVPDAHDDHGRQFESELQQTRGNGHQRKHAAAVGDVDHRQFSRRWRVRHGHIDLEGLIDLFGVEQVSISAADG